MRFILLLPTLFHKPLKKKLMINYMLRKSLHLEGNLQLRILMLIHLTDF
jgi:hypothetical protein